MLRFFVLNWFVPLQTRCNTFWTTKATNCFEQNKSYRYVFVFVSQQRKAFLPPFFRVDLTLSSEKQLKSEERRCKLQTGNPFCGNKNSYANLRVDHESQEKRIQSRLRRSPPAVTSRLLPIAFCFPPKLSRKGFILLQTPLSVKLHMLRTLSETSLKCNTKLLPVRQ